MRLLAFASGAAIAVFSGATVAQAESLSLKGYEIGASMDRCPAERVYEGTVKGVTQCWMGRSTLANEPATEHVVFLIGGRVAGTSVQMKSRGLGSNHGVLAALKARYGEPTDKGRDFLGEYSWTQGDILLSADTVRGTFIVQDMAAFRENARAQGEKAKSDL